MFKALHALQTGKLMDFLNNYADMPNAMSGQVYPSIVKFPKICIIHTGL